MEALLILDGVRLDERSAPIRWILNPGDSVALMGPPGSGKSLLTAALRGEVRAASGSVIAKGGVGHENRSRIPVRATARSIAVQCAGKSRSGEMADVLSRLGLWEVRQRPVQKLSDSQQAACRLLPVLLGPSDLMVVDGLMDRLGPWTLLGALDVVKERCSQGGAAIIATQRTDIAHSLGSVAVMDALSLKGWASVEALVAAVGDQEWTVETNDPTTARALVEPFAIEIVETERGLLVTARPGQELAAKLLLEGYGRVQAVVRSRSNLADAVVQLVQRGSSELGRFDLEAPDGVSSTVWRRIGF